MKIKKQVPVETLTQAHVGMKIKVGPMNFGLGVQELMLVRGGDGVCAVCTGASSSSTELGNRTNQFIPSDQLSKMNREQWKLLLGCFLSACYVEQEIEIPLVSGTRFYLNGCQCEIAVGSVYHIVDMVDMELLGYFETQEVLARWLSQQPNLTI